MKQTEIDALLKQTLEDGRLSRSEKQALDLVLADLDPSDDERQFFRHRAFAVAREALSAGGDRQTLDWLEKVVKALDAPRVAPNVEISAYFTPGDECVHCITRLLGQARASVDVCVFTITDNRLAEALEDTHRRGVAVRIITDDDKSLDLGSDVERLMRAGIPVRTDESEHHMHHKFAVFDRETVLTGSYNWTRSAAMHNRENLVVTREPKLARTFGDSFDSLWQQFAPTPQ